MVESRMFAIRFALKGLSYLVFVCLATLVLAASAQQPAAAPTGFAEDLKSPATTPEAKLKQMFEIKIDSEWKAIKNKETKAYGDLLAADYEGVEIDGKGERNKAQAVAELAETNVSNYTLWGFKLIALGADAALTSYEVTMQFPPKSQVRFSRVYISALWMKRGGEWKEVHYQETHVK